MITAHAFVPTRAAGLARLQQFLPAAGRAYAATRNEDRGPTEARQVSALSPWIRRRLLTESEVVAAVLTRHSAAAAEKFIQEVVWRGYWKGYLEMRPGLYARYLAECDALRSSANAAQQQALKRAEQGQTGIECYDAWVQELRSSGWLHNHTRMWFASIWIHTLKLPWQLGAEFFYEHLLDADPAANTLSWRWVAGLHTPGKHYLARAKNIRRYTLGRYDPQGQLDEHAAPQTEALPPPAPIALPPAAEVQAARVALLLTDEDLHPESWALTAEVQAVALLDLPLGADRPAARFSAGARADALARARRHFGVDAAPVDPAALCVWARDCGVRELVTAYAPVGAVASALDLLAPPLAAAGIRLVRLRRAWDTHCWPHARAGYFKLKTQIPQLLQTCLAAPDTLRTVD